MARKESPSTPLSVGTERRRRIVTKGYNVGLLPLSVDSGNAQAKPRAQELSGRLGQGDDGETRQFPPWPYWFGSFSEGLSGGLLVSFWKG